MLKIAFVLFCIYIQVIAAKKAKRPPTTLEKATTTVSAFLEDVTDFLKDMLDAFTDMFDTKPIKKITKTNNWSLSGIYKFAKNNLRTGYKVLQDSISLLDMARSTVDDVAPILPNVPPAQFIEALLNRLVPELMNLSKQVDSSE